MLTANLWLGEQSIVANLFKVVTGTLALRTACLSLPIFHCGAVMSA